MSVRVGRMAADCRDRFKNHISNRDIRNSGMLRIASFTNTNLNESDAGKWSQQEEDDLKSIVMQMNAEQPGGKISWARVSKHMGNMRGQHQCREKW